MNTCTKRGGGVAQQLSRPKSEARLARGQLATQVAFAWRMRKKSMRKAPALLGSHGCAGMVVMLLFSACPEAVLRAEGLAKRGFAGLRGLPSVSFVGRDQPRPNSGRRELS